MTPAKWAAVITWVLMVLVCYFLIPFFVPFGRPIIVAGMPWYFWWTTIWMVIHFIALVWYSREVWILEVKRSGR